MESNKYVRLTSVGTSQEGRAFPALDFDYVKIDERSFEDLLVFASGFSRLINFYNFKNKVEGDWSEFLTDETVILATIIDSNPSGIEISFKNNVNKAKLFKRPAKKVFYLRKCFQEIYDMAFRFQVWVTKLKAVEVFTGQDLLIKNEISNAISSKLGAALKVLLEQQIIINRHLSDEEKLDFSFVKFEPVWGLRSFLANPHEEAPEADFIKDADHVSDQLQQSFQAFYETLLYLKVKAPEYLQQSLRSDTHYPEVSLFLAFLKLFKYAQGNINNLSKRHLDFYYSVVLSQKPKEPVRDKVYLKFLPYDNAVFAQVKKGTSFIAGEDESGNEVIYEADYDLQVNKASIERLRTVHISKKTFNVRGTEKTIFKEVLSSDAHISALTRTPEDNMPRKSFATFGESQDGKGSHEKTMADAKLGFAIASPVLFLKEGYREISLNLQFSPDTFQGLIQKLEDIAYVENNPEDEIFVKSFLEAFGIEITTPEGWYQVKKYVVSRNVKTSSLYVSFDLDESEPPVVRYNEEVHEGIFQTKSPLIKLYLNSETYIYPYSLLKDLILEEVDIKVNVRGVKDILLYNNMGQLSPDNIFYPFGPMPNVGSYLLIGSNEVFRKSLENLNVNIEWFDLPRSRSGFYGHYTDYGLQLDNASFEARISVLENGRWKPSAKEQQEIKLFRSEGNPESPEVINPKSALDEQTLIQNIEIGKIRQAPDYAGIEQNLIYTSTSQRGFVKLELSNPDYAFAHTVYPSVLSETAIRNSKTSLLQLGEKKMEKMPNAPYSPQIKSISLDYSSSSVISLKDRSKRSENNDLRGTVYHLHPFGEELVYPDNSSQVTFLLPDYSYEGSLMIGFSNLNPPQTISMLFEMFDEYTVSSEEDPPVIEWNYLADNRWHYLKPSKIVRDDTNGFIKTGIIEIELPHNINRNNTILDPSLYWVRACVLKNVDTASNTVSVYTQALTATLSPSYNMNGGHLKKPLPAFTIKRSMENIEGIEAVIQPLDSFNNRPKEDTFDFYTRVGERLRHKARAIMPWDYERIILEKFSSVYKVACLPNMTSKNMDAPGSVLIVVCPYVNQNVEVHEPMASSELLYQIKNYLSQFVSPFVKLEVRNPSYERIKIICSVKFTDGYNYGYFLQKLNEELKKYLSKSTTGGQSSLHLGGKVNTSDILSFMRTLPYVDFITKFSMVQAARNFAGDWMLIDTAREGDTKAYLQATKPWSVLVPAVEHQITVLNEKLEERSLQAGIDSLELGHDFIIE